MRYCLALILLLTAPVQAVAFSEMQQGDCAAAWKIINKAHETRALLFKRSLDGWCHVPTFVPDTEAVIKGFDFDQIEWRAEGLERVLEQSLPPTALAIRVTDADMLRKLGLRGDVDLPVIPMQIVLVLRQNAKDRQLVIENLTISGPKGNEVSLRGVFHNVDLSSTAKMQISLGGANLRDVVLVATANRKLEPYLRPYIGKTFPERTRKRSAMIDKVAEWPDHSFPPETKRAVQQLIAVLPAPNGTLRVKVDTGAGLSAAIFVQTYVFGEPVDDMINRVLGGVVFNANWTAAE